MEYSFPRVATISIIAYSQVISSGIFNFNQIQIITYFLPAQDSKNATP